MSEASVELDNNRADDDEVTFLWWECQECGLRAEGNDFTSLHIQYNEHVADHLVGVNFDEL